jgi:hypothetical protein
MRRLLKRVWLPLWAEAIMLALDANDELRQSHA